MGKQTIMERKREMYRFTDDCMTGIGEIDEEHKRLFQLINEAEELLQGGGDVGFSVQYLLKELQEYAATHFAHEEAYMERIGDRELARQKREHAQFAAKISGYNMDSLTKENGRETAKELLAYMAKWLYSHILGSDIMIGKFTGEEKEEDAFAFTDKYKTGIEFVDEEHKKLFEIIRETNDVIKAELVHDKFDAIVHILESLKEYTILHFQDEENYMESIGYEGLAMQKAAHTAFVDRLNEISLDDVDDNQKEYLEELIDFLLSWLTNHILKMDKQIPVK